GAPVFCDPRNNFVPSLWVMVWPLARFEPSFAWNPSTITSVPAGNEAFVMPRRSREFGAPPSIIQLVTVLSEFFTSTWIQACGLIHSTLVTVPRRCNGRDESNSAAKAWCAHAGPAPSNNPSPAALQKILRMLPPKMALNYFFRR